MIPNWLLTNWSRAGLVMAVMLLALAPLIFWRTGVVFTLVFLQLPVYMIHQYEEHSHGQFKKYLADSMGGGREILTGLDIFWINIGMVWALDLAVLYAANFYGWKLGMIAVYLSTFNAVTHIVVAVRNREYNPGLWTSLVLFLPVGVASLYAITAQTDATLPDHATMLAAAIAGHVGIIGLALYRRRTVS